MVFTSHNAAHNFNKYFTTIANNLIQTTYDSTESNDNENIGDFKNYLPNLPPDVISQDFEFNSDELKNIILQL